MRVFCDGRGRHGNPLGCFLDGPAIPPERRQAIARDLDYSETIFIDDAERGEYRIFTPEIELPFAGHPTVGAAWLLAAVGTPPEVLRPPAGEVAVRYEDQPNGLVWISGRAEWAPPFAFRQLGLPEQVDGLEVQAEEVFCWAWSDEAAGKIRARCFVPEVGVAEDEATGSATLALCVKLGREIEVHQGAGSQLFARPLGDGDSAEVGGRVELEERRPYRLPS